MSERRPAFEMAPDAPSDAVAITVADLVATPQDFVDACAAKFGLDGDALSDAERATLIASLEAGRSRLTVMEALRAKASPLDANGAPRRRRDRTQLAGLAQNWTADVVVDLLLRYAPDDDGRFVEQAFRQIFGRDATQIEALEARFDLRGGRLDRRALIEKLAALSPGCRLSPPPSQAPLPAIPGGAILRDGGGVGYTLVRNVPGVGWVVAPDVIAQPMQGENGAFVPAPGVALRARGLTLTPGRWRLAVDLVQDETADIVVEVLANAGLDELFCARLRGPATFAAVFDVEDRHHFVEVRVVKPSQGPGDAQLKIRDLSLDGPS